MVTSAPIPDGYQVDQPIDASTVSATDASGRRVLLKLIPDDCLNRGDLHTSVRERLVRVRELAHGGVANLLAVERAEDAAWMVWEHGDGTPIRQASIPDSVALRRIGHRLVSAVQLLHARGIVHGQLSPSSVIITSHGDVRLTLISPLLYMDVGNDVVAVREIISHLARSRGDIALADRVSLANSLDELSAKLYESDGAAPDACAASSPPPPRVRRRAIVAAVVTATVGIGLAGLLYRWAVGEQ